MSPVTTFASQAGRTAAATTTTTPLPAFVAGVQADVRGTLVAVHFRDERGFAIFSLEQADGSRTRALGYLPPGVTLRAVVRVGGTWTRHAQYGWQVQVKTVELVDHLDRRGVVAFLVAYTTHLGPVRAVEAVERFGDRVFEVIRESPEDLCAINGITPSRARAVHESFAQVATIANVDSWLRHIGLGKADARRVREATATMLPGWCARTRIGLLTRSTALALSPPTACDSCWASRRPPRSACMPP